MSDPVLQHFRKGASVRGVVVPDSAEVVIDDWQRLRFAMARQRDPAFTRDEWAYLMHFLAAEALLQPWHDAFGEPCEPQPVDRIATAPRRVALWLPNNVSLLGCLTLVLLSLTGAEVRVKSGSRSRDLCAAFVEHARAQLPEGRLRTWLREAVHVRTFDRRHPENAQMSAWADARILFGSDEAAAAVESLPHAGASPWFAFGHKVSEAWIAPAAAREPAVVRSLFKVFSVFGQAGCTSPRRVVLVDGDRGDALQLREAMEGVWNERGSPPPPAQASEVLLGEQWARAEGFEAHRLPRNTGLLVLSPAQPARVFAHFGIQFQWGSLDDICATAAPNLQSIGHAAAGVLPDEWLAAASRTAANRIVPLAAMHDFGPVWDGIAWWESLFRQIEVSR